MRLWQHRTRALMVVMALATTACGSRLTTEEILAQNTVVASGSGLAAGEAGAGSEVSGTPGSVTSSKSGSAAAGTAGANAGGTKSGSSAAEPIVIGLVGYLSGIGGGVLSPARDAWVAWQRSVNARGGINGHQVELLTGDDGGNASRSLAIARDFVENQGAIALTYVGPGMPIGDYARSKRVPIIGTILGSPEWQQNPMLFAPVSGSEGTSWGDARLIREAGLKKVASVYCVESADCEEGSTRFAKYAAEEGLEVVYQGSYSVLQPDFTSVCLELQRSGAEAVLPSGDTNSMIRMAQSCSRQNFRPTWVTPTANDAIRELPEFDGAIAVSVAFPWFLRSGSPAIDEYVAALKAYAPDRLTTGATFQAWGWTAAKLFEAAAAHVSVKPTSQNILDALWSMKGETLGGLTPGSLSRTYTRDQPTPDPVCVFSGRIKAGVWTAERGLTPICR